MKRNVRKVALRHIVSGAWRVVVPVVCAMAFFPAALAGSLVVGSGESLTVSVPEGGTAAYSPVSVSDRAELFKTGPGTLRIETGALWQNVPFRVAVREGTVDISASDEEALPLDTVSNVLAKAAFWVDASSSAVVTNGTDASGNITCVKSWNDVREPARTADDASAYSYIHAEPRWDPWKTTAKGYGIPPVISNHLAGTAVYFGGGNSSKYMRWIDTDGEGADVEGITDVFYVTDLRSRYVFTLSQPASGETKADNTDFQPADCRYYSPFANFALAVADGGVLHIDGERVDPVATASWRTGLQVHDLQLTGMKGNAGVFYSDRPDNLATASTLSGRSGGDCMFECVIFTNALTATERMYVSRYLMRKYGKTRSATEAELLLAEGAKASVSVAEGDRSLLEGLSREGKGAVEKLGEGQLETGFGWEDVGRFILSEGTLRMRKPQALEMEAGKILDARWTGNSAGWNAGGIVSAASGQDAVTAVKAGAGNLRVNAVAEGVSNLVVSAGVLSLEARASGKLLLAPGSSAEAVIPNAGFEEAEGAYATGSAIRYFAQSQTAGNAKGWYGVVNEDAASTSGCGVGFNSPVVGENGTTSNWPTGNKPAPEGSWVMCMKKNVTAWTFAEIPVSGVYRFGFDVGARDNNANVLEVLVGPEDGDLELIARVRPIKGFRRYEARTGYLTAGTYKLCFRMPTADVDRTTAVDDLELTLEPASVAGEWKVPNGDFETVGASMTGLDFLSAEKRELEGWTFTYGDVTVNNVMGEDQCEFADVMPVTTDLGVVYVDFYPPELSESGRIGLLMLSTNGSASTSFTPPAGTWYLAARTRRFGLNTGNKYGSTAGWNEQLSVAAEISAENAGKTELGSVSRDGSMMERVTWPEPFTVDGETEMTLVLRQTNEGGAGVIDDLVLVPADVAGPDAEELVVNGGFESSGSGWTYAANTVNGNDKGKSQKQEWRSTDDYRRLWGAPKSGYDGENVWRVTQIGYVYQDVTVPEDGMYRFSFRALSRRDAPGNGRNPVRAYLVGSADASLTNEIGYAEVASTNFLEHVFHVPLEAGGYRLHLQGANDVSVTGVSDRSSLVDCVSLRRAAHLDDGLPEVPDGLNVRVDAGAMLSLDFTGTLDVASVRLGGKKVYGEISASTHPGYVKGPGKLYSLQLPPGLRLIVR